MALTGGKPNNVTMAYHWARMIELLHSAEKIARAAARSATCRATTWSSDGRAARRVRSAIIEAPRGTLFHHYRVDENDQVTMANLIVSTTNNNEPMNRAVRKVADDHLSGKPEITEGLLNHIEVGDPRLRPLPLLRHPRAGPDAARGDARRRRRRGPSTGARGADERRRAR